MEPLLFQKVECDLGHLDGVEFSGPWICALSCVSRAITLVILLFLNNFFCVVLVKHRIHIEEVYAMYINLVDILFLWIT